MFIAGYRIVVLFVVVIGLTALDARSQDLNRIYRIGVLTELSQKTVENWRPVLRRRGYVEGVNATLTFRAADGNFDLLPSLAQELAEQQVDVILTLSTPPARAARAVTNTIPIVTVSADPIGAGLVESLARPGGNVTGLFLPLPDLAAKRLQLLKETVPNLRSVAVLWNPNNQPVRLQLAATESVAHSLGMKLYLIELAKPTDLKRAFQMIESRDPGGLIVLHDPTMLAIHQQLADFSIQNRLPASHAYREFVDAGGLMSYGFSLPGLWEAAAAYADKILKGTRPEHLPMEQPTRTEFVINLRAANAMRLRIPESILLRADEVVQ